jgi:UDP-GlcNAc:undecaprenyl-phosphate GlcNAc-1-phosphate transferase
MTATYLGSALAALVLVLGLTPFLRRLAERHQVFMPPVRERDQHQQPTPRIGGIAIITATLFVIGYWLITAPDQLAFTSSTFLRIDRNLLGLIIAIVLLAVVNILDDYRGVAVRWRLLIEVVAAATIVLFGIGIHTLSNPFGGQIELGAWSGILVILWLVGLSNVVNWLDGVDGLASGVAAIALATLFFLSTSPHIQQQENALLAAIIFGAVIGFMPFNIGQKAFLGDSGSVFLGFMIGVLAIISGGKIATAFLVLAIPFMDAVSVFVSRLYNHQSPFMADRRHLHHRLLKLGMKSWQIVGLFYAISLAFGLVALNTQTLGKLHAAAWALALMLLLIAIYTVAGYLERRDGRNI